MEISGIERSSAAAAVQFSMRSIPPTFGRATGHGHGVRQGPSLIAFRTDWTSFRRWDKSSPAPRETPKRTISRRRRRRRRPDRPNLTERCNEFPDSIARLDRPNRPAVGRQGHRAGQRGRRSVNPAWLRADNEAGSRESHAPTATGTHLETAKLKLYESTGD